MENLLASHVLRHGPVDFRHIPKQVQTAAEKCVEVGADFAPGWVAKACKAVKHGAEAFCSEDAKKTQIIREVRVEVERIVEVEKSLVSSAPSAVTTPAPPSFVTGLLVSLQTAVVSFALNAFMSAMFGGDDDNSECDAFVIMMNEMRAMFEVIAQAVSQLRREMHDRFDGIDKKLAVMHTDIVFFGNCLRQQVEAVGANVMQLGVKLDVVGNKLGFLEELSGETLQELAWRKVYTVMLDMQLWGTRFGFDVPPPRETVIEWIVTVENALLQPAALKWLSMSYFASQPHTAELDAKYFKGVDAADVVGWLTEGRVLALPFKFALELLKTYHSLRLLARVVAPRYDSTGVCLAKVLGSFHDVVLSEDDIRAKLQLATSQLDALIAERDRIQRDLSRDAATKVERWKYRFQQRCREYEASIPNLDPRVRWYYNNNGEDVRWYEQQMLSVLQAQFRDELKRLPELTLEADMYPVVVAVKQEHTQMWLSNKPFFPGQHNVAMIRSSLKPLMRADALEWGSLTFHVEVQTHSDDLFGLADGKISAGWSATFAGKSIPWCVRLHATWQDATGLTTRVATFNCPSGTHSVPITHNQWLTYIAFGDINICVSPVYGTYLGEQAMQSVFQLESVNRDLIRDMASRLEDYDINKASDVTRITELRLEEFRNPPRASLRWLQLVGTLSESVVEAFERGQYDSVKRSLLLAPMTPWSSRMHTIASSLFA